MERHALQIIQHVFSYMEGNDMTCSKYNTPKIKTIDMKQNNSKIHALLKDDTCYFHYNYCQPNYSGGFCEAGYQTCKLAYHIS